MKIVGIEDTELAKSPNVRGGSGHSTRVLFDSTILDADPSRLDNFYAGISILGEGEFSTPRHRHNFDQWRFVIKGEADFGDGVLKEGMLGYFPEGAYYGPQNDKNVTVIVVQFGSVSGSGYIERGIAKAAHTEMKAHNTGYFEDGTYYRNPGVEGPPSQDGNEAIFEYVTKRPVVYPEPQYAQAILINPKAFPWAPKAGAAGTYERFLGTFSSCRLGASTYRLDPGATLEVSGRGIFVVLSGSGTLEARPYGTWTAMYLDAGETGRFSASEETEIVGLGLPAGGWAAISSEPVKLEKA